MTANPQLEQDYSKLNQHIGQYIKPNNRKAWMNIGESFLIEAVAVIMINLNFYYSGWLLHSLNMVRFFVQFHDTAHFNFFETPELNRFVGRILGIYVHFPFQMWRDGHNYHHRHFGNLDKMDLSQTILWNKKDWQKWSTPKKIAYRIFRQPILFFGINIQIIWFFGVSANCIKKYGLFSQAVLDKILSVVLIYVYHLIGLPAFEMYMAAHVGMGVGTIVFHLQHACNMPYRERNTKWSYTRAALEGSTYMQLCTPLKWLSDGIEYHHIHHLNTNVASYNIRRCHEDLKKKKGMTWEEFHINKVGCWLCIKSLLNVMYDEEKQIVIPFSYTSL